MAKDYRNCANYCFLISVAGVVFLVYLTGLSYYSKEEFTSKLEKDSRGEETTVTLLIAAGIYFAIMVLCGVLKCSANRKVDPMDYHLLPDR